MPGGKHKVLANQYAGTESAIRLVVETLVCAKSGVPAMMPGLKDNRFTIITGCEF